ncbi:MAG TPA: lanthionine synthetase LanC family protein [Rhizomicrobium sp.]
MNFAVLRTLPLVLLLLGAPASGVAGSLVDEAAQGLTNRAEPVTWIEGHRTGSAWKSVIQTPHYQTDRDVGAASAGMGLLAAYDVTGNETYLRAASAAGDFLVAAQVPGESGRWPDYFDPSGPAAYSFTSFNDGAPGIGDFLWRLFERTGDARYEATALAGMNWVISKAEAPKGKACPGTCFWHWQDPAGKEVYTGMGEGVAGIAWTLNEFAQRRAGIDPAAAARFARYAQGAASWLEAQMVRVKLPDGQDGAKMPERPGEPVYDTGFLSGSAGDAFLFYRLYMTTGRAQYRRDADLLFAWVRSQAESDSSCPGLKWPVETRGLGRGLYATGFEQGNAGIGWVAVQAYRLLIRREPALAIKDLQVARAAGDWLLSTCAGYPKHEQAYWPEDQGHQLIHTSLDSGAPGIGIFLHDLYGATGAPAYHEGADEAQRWIEAVAFHDRNGAYWCEHIRDGSWHLCGDYSWRWGAAGIVDFAARLKGWSLDIPGEQTGFTRDR